MSKITMGKILRRPADERRRRAWEALELLRGHGLEAGAYLIEVEPGASIRVDLDDQDVERLQRLDALFERISSENADALVAGARSEEIDDQRALCWFALSPVRIVGWGGGEYDVRLPGGVHLSFVVTAGDAALLRSIDALLEGIVLENPAVFQPFVGSRWLAAA